MTKTKTTKSALFASVLSLLLCVSMLIGSTFAWFTDSASTGVNTIKSGTLDVGLEMLVDGEWVDAEGQTLGFVDEDGNILENILWEPGCSYLLQPFKIINNGDLALKFDVVVSGFSGNAKLAEAIEYGLMLGDVNNLSYVKVGELNNFDSLFDGIKDSVLEPGESSDTSEDGITLHMKETAGNEYQNLTLSGMSITIIATQATVEKDSYTDQYDKDAEYPADPVDPAAAYLGLTQVAADGGTYEVKTDVTIPVNKTETENGSAVAGVTHELLTFTKDTTLNLGDNVISLKESGRPIQDFAITVNDADAKVVLNADENGGIDAVTDSIDYACAIAIRANGGTLIINGGTYRANEEVVYIYNKSTAHVVINGGFFESTQRPASTINAPSTGGSDNIKIYGGTFVNFDPSNTIIQNDDNHNYVADGYHVESAQQSNGDTWYTVVAD